MGHQSKIPLGCMEVYTSRMVKGFLDSQVRCTVKKTCFCAHCALLPGSSVAFLEWAGTISYSSLQSLYSSSSHWLSIADLLTMLTVTVH